MVFEVIALEFDIEDSTLAADSILAALLN